MVKDTQMIRERIPFHAQAYLMAIGKTGRELFCTPFGEK
jgi:hypothetical protein